MAHTEAIKRLVMVIIIFNFIGGSIGFLDGENKGSEFNIEKLMPVKNTLSQLKSFKENTEPGFLSGIASLGVFMLAPFIIIDGIIIVISLLGYGFTVIPNIFNIILFAPLSIFIFIDYVLPMLRGN